MKPQTRRPPLTSSRGFTLVELTIVLVIVALLLGGLTTAFMVQQDNASIKETRQTLATINEALLGFAVANGRLPRPAQSGTNGLEATVNCATTTACTGFIPWQTLGVAKSDAWGKLIRYSVTPAFSNSTPFTLTSIARFKVYSRDSAGNPVYLVGSSASNCDAATNLCAPAIVFSSGKSNHGWLDDGTEIADSSASNVDEEANAGPVADASDQMSFVSRSFSTGGTGGEFDDILVWVPVTVLFNRMIAAGKLP